MSLVNQHAVTSASKPAGAVVSRSGGVSWWRVPTVAFGVWLALTVAVSLVMPPRTMDQWVPMIAVGMLAGAVAGGRAGHVRRAREWMACVALTFVSIVFFGYLLFAVLVMMLPVRA
jgi:hypothetical protein